MQVQTTKKGDPKMLPPTPRKRQQGGPKKRVVTFRPPAKLLAYLEDMEARGFDLTASLLDLAEPMMEVREAVGLEWWDLVKLAESNKESIGATVARLVRAGLKKK